VNTIFVLAGIAAVAVVGMALFATSHSRRTSRVAGILINLAIAFIGFAAIVAFWDGILGWLLGGGMLSFGGYQTWATITHRTREDDE
jgi:hypothetical protein